MTTEQAMQTIQNRIDELVKDSNVQNKMMEFATESEARQWLTNLAIYTLCAK